MAGGVDYVADEVTGISAADGRATAVTLGSGETVAAGCVVNAAGTRAGQVAGYLGIALPVAPRKRTVFILRCESPPPPTAPLMINTDGVFSRPEGGRFISGISPEIDSGSGLGRFRAQLGGVRGGDLAGTRGAVAELRGDPHGGRLGRAL